jgi:acetyltransferase-like isoleucine patch superfamily enzyme
MEITVIYVCYNSAMPVLENPPPFPSSPVDGLHWALERLFRKLRICLFSLVYRNWLRLRGVRIGRGVKFEGRVLLKGAHRVKIGKKTVVGRFTQLDTLDKGYIMIGERCFIGHFSIITANEQIKIGDDTLISPNCFITDMNHSLNLGKPIKEQAGVTSPVTIGSDIWLGTMTVVAPGVVIGDGAVLGAGSFVNSEIPPRAIAVGQPARVIKYRDEGDSQGNQ